jgi:hypothetical protein
MSKFRDFHLEVISLAEKCEVFGDIVGMNTLLALVGSLILIGENEAIGKLMFKGLTELSAKVNQSVNEIGVAGMKGLLLDYCRHLEKMNNS